LRNIKASSAIQEFYEKITQLEAQRSERKEGETEKSIANVIRSFPIPNTKEDVLEFMTLAASNVDASLYSVQENEKHSTTYQSRKTVNDAWSARAEQIYHKAKLSFENDADFSTIQELYARKIKSIRAEKRKGIFNIFGSVISKLFRGIEEVIHKKPEFLLILILGGMLMAMPAFRSIMFGGAERDHQRKEQQLEAIVVEVQDCIANEDYDTAYIKAQGLYMDDGWSSESAKRWDKVRNELITLIETKSGVIYTNSQEENEDSTDSVEESSKYIDEFKENSKEFRENMDEITDEMAETYKSVFDGYKNIFSGIFN